MRLRRRRTIDAVKYIKRGAVCLPVYCDLFPWAFLFSENVFGDNLTGRIKAEEETAANSEIEGNGDADEEI